MIKINKIQCKKCGDIIESKHRHDFVTCKCGAIFTDGGLEYFHRSANIEDYNDLSVWVDDYSVGAILCTKDGRKIGNAIVAGSGSDKTLGTIYFVETDFGNVVGLTMSEMQKLFYTPEHIQDYSEWKGAKIEKNCS